MKKIKGSLSAIRMSHLIALFAVITVSGLALRTYQLLVMVNPANGFFENANFAVPVLYGILAVGCVLFLVLSFLSKNVPAPKLPEGRNIPLGIASFVAATGFVWDAIIVARDIFPDMSGSVNNAVFDGLMLNYIKANGGVFVVLELVFAVLSMFYFWVFGMSHFEGKATYKKISVLSIAPGCWAMFVLISKLMKAVSFITVSELLFEIAMLVFTMLFFLTFARIVSGVFTVNSMWCTYGCGFPAAIFAGLISVPRGILLAVGKETVEGSDFSFTHLFLFVFIIVYITSTLGVGFKNSLKKMQSVSNVFLPDDDEVVVKSSASPANISEGQETEQSENTEKKRFSIAPEFKNMGDLDNFFDDEPENDVAEDVENIPEEAPKNEISLEEADNLPVDEVVEDYEEKVDEETDEACDEANSQIDDNVAFEENSQRTDTEPLEEITKASFEADREDTSEEILEETVEEINEPDEDELDFELTDIFVKTAITEEATEEVISEYIVDETVEEIESIEAVEEVIAEPVEETEVLEEAGIQISEETEKASVKASGGFLEFSQMLIDDFENEDLSDDTENEDKAIEKPENIKKSEDVRESEITEDTESENIKEAKVKKEKVKKEKPQKSGRSFGKKKKPEEDEEPLKIVSLADLKNKKD